MQNEESLHPKAFRRITCWQTQNDKTTVPPPKKTNHNSRLSDKRYSREKNHTAFSSCSVRCDLHRQMARRLVQMSFLTTSSLQMGVTGGPTCRSHRPSRTSSMLCFRKGTGDKVGQGQNRNVTPTGKSKVQKRVRVQRTRRST